MINNRIVLVLGAGASIPYQFPSGAELKAEVRNLGTVQRGTLFSKSFAPGTFDQAFFSAFQENLAKSPLKSIDAFLEARPDYLEIGKHTIAFLLINREHPNQLLDAKMDSDENWYKYIFGLMLDEGLGQLAHNKLTVITFNYDRSFEYYFVGGLMSSYDLSFQEATQAMSFMDVIHVHGELGKLIESGLSDIGRSYEPVADASRVAVAARGIKIISDLSEDTRTEEWSGFRQAWRELKQTDCIVYLGFGYNRNNIRRLMLGLEDTDDDEMPFMCGTTFDLTLSEMQVQVIPAFDSVGQVFSRFEDSDSTVLTFTKNHLDLFIGQ